MDNVRPAQACPFVQLALQRGQIVGGHGPQQHQQQAQRQPEYPGQRGIRLCHDALCDSPCDEATSLTEQALLAAW